MSSFWAARPYTLVDARAERSDDDDDDGSEGARAAGSKAAARKAAELKEARRSEWDAENVTPGGRRPRYAPPRFFFIPEHGRALDGRIDGAHFARLRAAIVAWVACNPGLAEEELLDRFWGHPICLVRGMLHAMEVEGTLRRSLLARPPQPLFGRTGLVPPTHFFLGPNGRSLTDHGAAVK